MKNLTILFCLLLSFNFVHAQEEGNYDEDYFDGAYNGGEPSFDNDFIAFSELAQVGLGVGYVGTDYGPSLYISKYFNVKGDQLLFGFRSNLTQLTSNDALEEDFFGSIALMGGGFTSKDNWYFQYNTGIAFGFKGEQNSSFVNIGLPIECQAFYSFSDYFGIGVNVYTEVSSKQIRTGANLTLKFFIFEEIPFFFF